MLEIPIAISIFDLHITPSNGGYKRKLIKQVIDKCLELKIKYLIIGGDIFDSRKSQPLDTLKYFERILNDLNEAKIKTIIIPGNHDRTDYESEDSYLDIYQHFPGVLKMVKDYWLFIPIKGIYYHFIPFFKEETTYPKYLNIALKNIEKDTKGKDQLFTHIAVNGVHNNDFQTVENSISPKNFKVFDKVFVGHYHCREQVEENIYYLGSLNPDCFAEDNEKGYTIHYSDGFFKSFNLEFKKYFTIEINADIYSTKELDELASKYANSKDYIRFKFTGSQIKLKGIDKSKYEALGIDVKIKRNLIEEGITAASMEEFVSFNEESLLKEFAEFAELNKIGDSSYGLEKLKGKLGIK